MKFLLIKLLLILFIPIRSDFTPFLDFVRFKFYPPESVKRVCTWQYAIIKVKTDRNNVITSYHVENKVSSDLINSFSFLKGYAFDKNIPINKHPIVFCVSIENRRTDSCDIPKPLNYKHEEPASKLKLYKLQHANKKMDLIYIKTIITEIVYDPIIN